MDHKEQVDLLRQSHTKVKADIAELEQSDSFTDSKTLEDWKQRSIHLGVLIDYFEKYNHLPICDETLRS